MGVEGGHHVGGLAGHARAARQHQGPGAGDPSGARRRFEAVHVHQVRARPRVRVHPRTCRSSRTGRGEDRARDAPTDLRQSRARARRACRCPRRGAGVGSPAGPHLRRTRCGQDRARRRVRAHGSGRRPGAHLPRSVLRPRAAARTLLPVSRRAHRARSPPPRIRAPHPRGARAVVAGALPAVEWLRSHDRARRPHVRRAGRRARRSLARPAARPHPRGSPVGGRRHDQRARAAGREPDPLEAAHRRDLLRRRVDRGRPGAGSAAGRRRDGATFGDAPAREPDARARGAIHRRALRSQIACRNWPRRSITRPAAIPS